MSKLEAKAIYLDQEPSEIDVIRRRGDTVSERFVLFANVGGSAVDITGYSFSLAVDPEPSPSGSANNVYAIAATLEDADSGLFYFPVSVANASAATGSFFYDMQATFDEEGGESGVIRTIARGRWTILQDIAK